jgi:hypothetical protein
MNIKLIFDHNGLVVSDVVVLKMLMQSRSRVGLSAERTCKILGFAPAYRRLS